LDADHKDPDLRTILGHSADPKSATPDVAVYICEQLRQEEERKRASAVGHKPLSKHVCTSIYDKSHKPFSMPKIKIGDAPKVQSRNSIEDIWGPRTPYKHEWPVRVDEAYDEEPEKWVQSACVLCSNGCGLDIGVKDGKVVGVRGRQSDRVNKGICYMYELNVRQTLTSYLHLCRPSWP
jgi:hypothetical protein